MTGLVGEHELVDAVPVGDAQGNAEPERRVVAAVVGDARLHGLGIVEQLVDRRAGQAARHEAERGERGVPTADVRVGAEDPVARLGGFLSRVGNPDR